MITEKKAILVVSFGTSHYDTRKVTIDVIEDTIKNTFPDYTVYRAWTSKIIIRILNARDGVCIPTVHEAMEQMKKDGITDVIIQPTHILNGIENDRMKDDVQTYLEQFNSVQFGNPLLTTVEDCVRIVSAISEEFSELKANQALVFMGHGSSHYSNFIYAAMDYMFKDMGYPNIFMGTVESYPSFDSVLKQVKNYGAEEIILAPFMIVAGDHAKNDMAGEEPDSWQSRFRQEGYPVAAILKSLGEFPAVHNIFLDHIRNAAD